MPNTPQTTVLEIKELGKRFGSQWVLAHINLTVRAGEAIALFGDNGSGKSTLIKILATLLEPTHGSVHVCGHNSRQDKKTVRRLIGLLGHEKQLYRSLTVLENIRLTASILGMSRKSPLVEEALEQLQMLPAQHKIVATISEGMKKRLALAKMWLATNTHEETQLVLLDEPHAGLDVMGKDILHQLLNRWRQEGKTVILASHDHELILPHVDRVLVLKKGLLDYDGPADQVNAIPYSLRGGRS